MNTFHKSSRQSGFTLLELLVSMLVVSLMATYALNLISRFKDIRRIELVASNQQSVQNARDHLRKVISGARARFKQLETGSIELKFKGAQESLTLSNVISEQLVFGNLHELTYRVVGSDLVLELDTDQNSQVDPQLKTVLLKDVESVSFRYFGTKQNETAATWHSLWSEKSLPQLVEIDVQRSDISTASWPRFVVALETAVTVYNAATN
jgi:prepilin-type N-terminal cleavage/methylation domain-containing protein